MTAVSPEIFARPRARAGTSTLAPAVAVAAIGSIGAGAIHAAAIGVHSEHRQAVITFTILAIAQLGWGVFALQRAGRQRLYLIAIIVGLSIFNAFAYPRVDGLKSRMQGSDEDDNLIQTSLRLVKGERPVYVHNYLGNAPTQGIAWALVVAPLTLSGSYFLLTPLALGALPVVVVAAGGGEAAATLATVLPLSSPAFWELLVTGSDLFAIGVLFAALTVAMFCWRQGGPGSTAACVALAVTGGTSRLVFAYPIAVIGSFMWKRDRAGAAFFVALSLVIVVVEYFVWWPDPDRTTPISLIDKGLFMLGPGALVVGAAATLAATAIAVAHVGDDVGSWMRGAWLGIAAMLGAIAVIDVVHRDFNLSQWQAASYPMVAVPLLVSFVALEVSRIDDQRSPLA